MIIFKPGVFFLTSHFKIIIFFFLITIFYSVKSCSSRWNHSLLTWPTIRRWDETGHSSYLEVCFLFDFSDAEMEEDKYCISNCTSAIITSWSQTRYQDVVRGVPDLITISYILSADTANTLSVWEKRVFISLKCEKEEVECVMCSPNIVCVFMWHN